MAKKEKEAESALGSARLPAPRVKGPGLEAAKGGALGTHEAVEGVDENGTGRGVGRLCSAKKAEPAAVFLRLFSLSWTAKKEKKGMAKKEKEAESALGSARLPAPRVKGPGLKAAKGSALGTHGAVEGVDKNGTGRGDGRLCSAKKAEPAARVECECASLSHG
ncbi:MAG: hypothetical protein K2L50_06215, partial [Bacteroidales bacterium]|nr:hypothetical protein [Bacteroidales bacterium]